MFSKLLFEQILVVFDVDSQWSEEKVTQPCPTLCDPMDLYSPWNSPGQNTGVGSLSLLWGIFQVDSLPAIREALGHSRYWLRLYPWPNSSLLCGLFLTRSHKWSSVSILHLPNLHCPVLARIPLSHFAKSPPTLNIWSHSTSPNFLVWVLDLMPFAKIL